MKIFFTLVSCAIACLAASLLGLAGCGGGGGKQTIVIYSPHGQYLQAEVKARFEAAYPQYSVAFLDMGGGTILQRLDAERERPQTDVWWGGAPGDFRRAEADGLLEPYAPAWTAQLPPDARSASGAWVATFRTPQVILFNPKKVKPEEIPADWSGLLDPKWKGRIAIRDVAQSTTMKTIFGAWIQREAARAGGNLEAGFEFLRKLDANTGVYAPNPQALNDLLTANSPYALTVWNMPDAMQLKDRLGLDYRIPSETPINYEPIAIVKGAPHPEAARLFHDFVNSPEQLVLMAQQRHRLPVRTDVPADKLPEWMRSLSVTPMPVDWSQLDQHLDEWIARWDREIKGKNK